LLKRATAQLEQVNSRILGVILNGMKPEVSPDFHNFKYYKYYSSYGEEGAKGEEPKKGLQFFRENGISWSLGKKGKKSKRSMMTFSLAGAGLILLAGAVLWQFGIIGLPRTTDSAKPAPHKTAQQLVRKVPPKPSSPPAPRVKQESANPPAAKVPAAKAPAPAVKQEPAPAVNKVQAVVREVAEEPLHETRPPVPAPKQAVEKKTVPVEKAQDSSPVSEGEYPYSIYLSSLKTLDLAKRAIAIYADKGIQAYWVKVQFKEKGEWYRIYAGHFKDPQEAEGFAQARGITENETMKTEYANLIGVYSQPGDLDEKLKAMSDLGYAPYTLKGSDGRLKLLVGAYVTEEAAEQQRRDLMGKGIENRVVKR
jgi:cell division protein FtsN